MKLLTIRAHGEFRPAVMIGDDVLDLVGAGSIMPMAAWVPNSIRAVIAGGNEGLALLSRVIQQAGEAPTRAALQAAGALMPFDKAELGPVVPDPNFLLAGSMNSRGHLEEMGDEAVEFPIAFFKGRSAIGASGGTINYPAGHENELDFEGEFCVVIGSTCHNVSPEQAKDHIFGYTLMNDISSRETVIPFATCTEGKVPLVMRWERNCLSKNFPGFAPIGPVIATKDEFGDTLSYHLETVVNGEVMQSSTQDDLVFNPAEMISYHSKYYIFEAGDIISMGSPPGVGFMRNPPQYLLPGDVVDVREETIGTLRSFMAS